MERLVALWNVRLKNHVLAIMAALEIAIQDFPG